MGQAISFPLFVPADRPDRVVKAAASGADAVLADLEDAVARDRKAEARAALLAVVSDLAPATTLCLRINAEGDPEHVADLDLACRLPLTALVLPKAESASAVARLRERTGLPVIALVETAKGLDRVEEIASESRQLAFGSIDFAADLGTAHSPMALLHARSRIVLAARLAGIAAPLDGVTTAVNDAEQLRRDCAHAVEMGFGGKLLIHPGQVAPARAAFAPDAATVDWARRVLEAEGGGAVLVRGEMVDAPVLMRARRVLARLGPGGA